ncbi:MAG: metal ABC transporter permease [Candidatus Methanomethylicaceae archaeon]|nr:metal ABC transporter permease [Candidatus Verstraetearchaeota archaeon]
MTSFTYPSISLMELLGYQFFQNAILGGIMAGFACAWIGLFLVLRKEAMIVDGVAHTAFGGVALGLLMGVDPLITALGISTVSVFGMSYMKRKGLAESDSAIALILAIGFSTGLIIISVAGGFSVDLFSYLFGSILTISRSDLLMILILGIVIVAFLMLLHRELLAITFDERSARMMGVPVNAISAMFNLIVAITITLSIKIIGIILVVALIVIPALTALQLRVSFSKTVASTIIIGLVSVVAGIIISSFYNVAASGIIVFTMVLIYLATAALVRVKSR